jgi:hypothetical protein
MKRAELVRHFYSDNRIYSTYKDEDGNAYTVLLPILVEVDRNGKKKPIVLGKDGKIKD